MIRVLNLFTILNRGGAETMCMNLYRHIDRTKVQFDFLVYHQERGIYEDEIESLGGHVFRIPDIHDLRDHIKGAREFFAQHNEFAAVHNHMQSNGGFICREARRAGIDMVIYHSHAAPVPIFSDGPEQAIKRLRNKMVNTLSLNNCSCYFACGEEAEKAIPKKYRPVVILRNAIDLNSFKYNPQVRENIRGIEGCENKLIVGNVARIDDNKNQTFAVDIIQQLTKMKPNCELWLIGDGSRRQQVEEKVREQNLQKHVRFLGVRTDVNALLQAMDVFLFPSIAEGLPVSCIEAQAAGLPCVFSDGFDPNTIITDNCTVMSLKQSSEKWAHAVLSASENTRSDTSMEIRRAGYDIKETARFMETYYLSKGTA